MIFNLLFVFKLREKKNLCKNLSRLKIKILMSNQLHHQRFQLLNLKTFSKY